MKSMSATLRHNRIAMLLEKSHALIPARAWSTVSGRDSFQGGTLEFDDTPLDHKRICDLIVDAREHDTRIVLWEPRGGEKPPVGFPEKTLHRGWTLTLDETKIVMLQRIVFVSQGIIDVPLETRTGRFIVAVPYYVSAWDGAVHDIHHPS